MSLAGKNFSLERDGKDISIESIVGGIAGLKRVVLGGDKKPSLTKGIGVQWGIVGGKNKQANYQKPKLPDSRA